MMPYLMGRAGITSLLRESSIIFWTKMKYVKLRKLMDI